MKRLYRSFLLTCIGLIFFCVAYGQGSLGISSMTITPSGTITSGTGITVQGSFVNTGTLTLAGTVTVNLAINTSTTSTPNYVLRNSATYTVSSFTTSSTHTFVLTDVASGANQYIVDGNGTTVVVWPVMTNVTTSDSSKKVIFVNVPAGQDELAAFGQELLKIRNPVSQNIVLNYDDLIYRRVELMNAQGQVVQLISDKTLQVDFLSPGIYYLNFHQEGTGRIVTKKLLLE